MTNFIFIYHDEFVLFPNETKTLHINKSSFIELLNDAAESKKAIGVIWKNPNTEYGTTIEIMEKTIMNNDEINITIKGLAVFKILEKIETIPNKNYTGAIVHYPENTFLKISPALETLINKEVFEKYKALQNSENVDYSLNSYNLALQIGVNNEHKYAIIQLFNEMQRMEYIRRFLDAKNDTKDNNLKYLLHNIDLN